MQQKEFSQRQKEIFENNITRGHNEQLKNLEKSQALLMTCKTWGGPCTNINEFRMCVRLCSVKNVPLKKMLKSEISMRKVTSPRDVVDRPHLYKLNTLTIEQLQENLTTLLTTEYKLTEEMPDDENILNKIREAFSI